jgi:hypothetical protein
VTMRVVCFLRMPVALEAKIEVDVLLAFKTQSPYWLVVREHQLYSGMCVQLKMFVGGTENRRLTHHVKAVVA